MTHFQQSAKYVSTLTSPRYTSGLKLCWASGNMESTLVIQMEERENEQEEVADELYACYMKMRNILLVCACLSYMTNNQEKG